MAIISPIPNNRGEKLQAVPVIELVSAIQRLASIHAGIPGQSIPREVMNFYVAMKGGDRFRPRLLREVMLSLRDQTACGIDDREALRTTACDRLTTFAARLPQSRLEQWLLANQKRERFIPVTSGMWLDRLRAGYVSEGMEILEDTLDYASARTV
jgi:hypothetical protein